MTTREELIAELGRIVGPAHVLTAARETRRFTRGFRYGGGPVAAVVRPGSLVEQWRVLNAVIAPGRIAIFQAANTGLTGGSTPWGDDYDREIVLVSTMRLKGIHLIDGGRQVLCLPGATLDPGGLQRAVEHLACRSDKGTSRKVLLIARLLADKHEVRVSRALAEHGLGRVLVERAARAALGLVGEFSQRAPGIIDPLRLGEERELRITPILRHCCHLRAVVDCQGTFRPRMRSDAQALTAF